MKNNHFPLDSFFISCILIVKENNKGGNKMKLFQSPIESINGHEWYAVSSKSDYDGTFCWKLFKDGREHKLEIDSIHQKTPKAAIALAYFFNSGINAALSEGGIYGK